MSAVAGTPRVGPLLRDWRHRRRLSQLDLAVEAGVSTRHLSFIETGRARPSADMVLHLAERLEVPLRERNALLLAAGHAPVFGQHELDSPELESVRAALDGVLAAHEPFPALAVDRHWGMVASNRAVAPLIAGADPALLAPPVNVLRLSLHPDGLAPRIVNLSEWRGHLLGRLAREVAATGDPALAAIHRLIVVAVALVCDRRGVTARRLPRRLEALAEVGGVGSGGRDGGRRGVRGQRDAGAPAVLVVAEGRGCQAGGESARRRLSAARKSSAHGQRAGIRSVDRRLDRVSRPGICSSRRRRVRAVRTVWPGSAMRCVQRSRLWASAAITVQAALAVNLPEGKCARPWPLRSRIVSSTTACRRCSASTISSGSVRLVKNAKCRQSGHSSACGPIRRVRRTTRRCCPIIV